MDFKITLENLPQLLAFSHMPGILASVLSSTELRPSYNGNMLIRTKYGDLVLNLRSNEAYTGHFDDNEIFKILNGADISFLKHRVDVIEHMLTDREIQYMYARIKKELRHREIRKLYGGGHCE